MKLFSALLLMVSLGGVVCKFCGGKDSGCCTSSSPCGVDDGDCDSHSDCQPGLVCGTNNCPNKGKANNNVNTWDKTDDCCTHPGERDIVLHCQREKDMNYIGNDIEGKNKMMNKGLDACITWCVDTPRCQFWTFNHKTKWCWLKYARVKTKYEETLISGNRICGSTISCDGKNSGCCTSVTPCGVDDGDCDSDNDCKRGLVCGRNNCMNKGTANLNVNTWDRTDDCCTYPAPKPNPGRSNKKVTSENVYYLDPSSSDQPGDFQKKINEMKQYDTLVVKEGIHYVKNTVHINKPNLVIIGERGSIIQVTDMHSAIDLDENSDRTVVENIFIDGANQEEPCMRVYSSNNRIYGSTFTKSGNSGLLLDGSSFNIITNCQFYDNYMVGLSQWNSQNNHISNCKMYKNGAEGLTVDGHSHNSDIHDNRIYANNRIFSNDQKSRGVGGIGIDASNGVKIYNNVIDHNGKHGITFQNNICGGCNNAMIYNNEICLNVGAVVGLRYNNQPMNNLFMYGNTVKNNGLELEKEDYKNYGCCSFDTVFMGKCYEYIDTAKTWVDADDDCSIRGGALVSIPNEEVNAFLHKLAPDDAWVGASDAEQEGIWVWPNGKEITYSNWKPGQPDNHNDQQHHMFTNGKTGKWEDGLGTKKMRYICQFPMARLE